MSTEQNYFTDEEMERFMEERRRAKAESQRRAHPFSIPDAAAPGTDAPPCRIEGREGDGESRAAG